MERATRRGVIRYVVREYFGVVFVALLLAWTSGRWDWPAGWAVVSLYFLWVTATVILIAPRSPELLADRARRRHPGTKGWDQVIVTVFGLETLARYVIAGLDARLGWTGGFPAWLQVLGAVMAAAGFAMVTWSMAANAFFSMVVRLQPERGHEVVSSGPYRWVRHPGYIGTCGFEIGTALLLGSWPAVLLGACGVGLFVLRTALEDRALRAELQGYEGYAQRVRWRLVPGLW